ncbi:hypothetical protein [Sinomonas halotolerans]|uniref:Uncharacterized protein n=1 Tax=Sinomonas halotolerans TaxID=1644133 RepID=A0ABU9WW17_9MICC
MTISPGATGPALPERLALLASRSTASPPDRLALASYTLAYSHGAGSTATGFLRSLAHRSRPDLLPVVSDASALSRLRSAGRSRALDSVTPARADAARRRLAVSLSRLAVARVLGPLPDGCPVSARAAVERRRVMAVVGSDLAARAGERGWDSMAVSAPRMVARLLMPPATVQRVMADLSRPDRLGWLRVHRRVAGGVHVYKAQRLSTRSEREAAEGLFDLIGELAEHALDPARPIGSAAALIARADHPAWIAGAGIGSRHWLALLARSAGVDPALVGLAGRGLSPLDRELAAAGLSGAEAWGGAELIAALDRIAAGTDVADRLEAAERERARAAADRLALVEAARAERAGKKRTRPAPDRAPARPADPAGVSAPVPRTLGITVPDRLRSADRATLERVAAAAADKAAAQAGGQWTYQGEAPTVGPDGRMVLVEVV